MDLNILKNLKFGVGVDAGNKKNIDYSARDVAIIGISAQVGHAGNAREFWESICQGQDMVRDFPEERWHDANELCLLYAGRSISETPLQYGYINRIDLFDADFFGISPKEAELMNPYQRIFLESAWSALEDAGYGNGQLSGTQTGVYIGCNHLGESYKNLVEDVDPFIYGMAVSGNVNSIIASRVSYFLNLKGPAVVFDTACSSSLAAVYFACRQIRDGEVSMAIVGGIRLTSIPPQQLDKNFGIESKTGRTKTFDNSADGTGGGEGSIAMVLKPLNKAIADNDNIYAIIKGSGINQDGASMGITAPNAASQEAVIRAAWKDAGIDPETISYIEAHGTATNLGDPVEISGIERAFRRFTDKNQFCAIGSAKSNVGHLDSAAGILGLLKAVLMLKYKRIPPTIHFKTPNSKIGFIDSPVYINDRLADWNCKDNPRRCGVSSFGISGTNCHMVLEEAPALRSIDKAGSKGYSLAISAKNKGTIIKIAKLYQDFLRENPDCDFSDFCYTVNTGRRHLNCRLMIITDSRNDFLSMTIGTDMFIDESCVYGEFKIVESSDTSSSGYISANMHKQATNEANSLIKQAVQSVSHAEYKRLLFEISSLYIRGADISWDQLYQGENRHRLSIPTYPYNHKRYWAGSRDRIKNTVYSKETGPRLHPLIDRCILDTLKIKVYSKLISNKTCWELKEHLINGRNVLPGTAFLEMAQFIGSQILKTNRFEMEELSYLIPLSCGEEEERTLHAIAKEENGCISIEFCSKNSIESQWICHAELLIRQNRTRKDDYCDIKGIVEKSREITSDEKLNNPTIVKITGTHWTNAGNFYASEDAIVLLLEANQASIKEKKNYYLYVPMLDSAINAGIFLEKEQYLPFSFSRACFYEALPERFYSYVKRVDTSDEFTSYDIKFCLPEGKVIGKLEKYTLKKVNNPDFFIADTKTLNDSFHSTSWIERPLVRSDETVSYRGQGIAVAIYITGQKAFTLLQKLKERYKANLITIEISGKYNKISDVSFMIGHEASDLEKVLKDIGKDRIIHIFQLTPLKNVPLDCLEALEKETDTMIRSTFNLVKALVKSGARQKIKMSIISMNSTRVTGDEKFINPANAALIGMGTCIEEEYGNIVVRSIDADENTDTEKLLSEVNADERIYSVAYRNNKRYIEKVKGLHYSEQTNQQELRLKDGGVYVIAGGMGGMGISLCSYLFSLNKLINVILINRTYSHDEFNSLSLGKNMLLDKKINVIRGLLSEGKNIEIVKADIADYLYLKKILDGLRTRYGSIHGVINAAGIAGDGFIMNKDWTTFCDVLKPKITGTWNLHELTANYDLDFFVMCSSFTSIFGGPGQSDYAAANAFLDSFSFYRRDCGLPSLTINWTGWSESGMAVTKGISKKGSYVDFVNDAEGAVAFAYAIKTGLPRVLVGALGKRIISAEIARYGKKIDLSDYVDTDVSNTSTVNFDEHIPDEIKDITIYGKSADEITDTEKQVLAIWARTLGINEVNVHDKFFESGGNSLLASHMQKELSKAFQGIVTIMDIFAYPSVLELAACITSRLGGSSGNAAGEILSDEDLEIENLIKSYMDREEDT